MKDNLIYLQHIRDSIRKIERYLKGVSYEFFAKNDMVLSAVIRELEVIGEAANNINENFRIRHPEIPWDKMIGMRNRLIHEYFGVNKKIVWETCKTDLKDLKKAVLFILRKEK